MRHAQSQKIHKQFGSNKTKGHNQDRQNLQMLPMTEGGDH